MQRACASQWMATPGRVPGCAAPAAASCFSTITLSPAADMVCLPPHLHLRLRLRLLPGPPACPRAPVFMSLSDHASADVHTPWPPTTAGVCARARLSRTRALSNLRRYEYAPLLPPGAPTSSSSSLLAARTAHSVLPMPPGHADALAAVRSHLAARLHAIETRALADPPTIDDILPGRATPDAPPSPRRAPLSSSPLPSPPMPPLAPSSSPPSVQPVPAGETSTGAARAPATGSTSKRTLLRFLRPHPSSHTQLPPDLSPRTPRKLPRLVARAALRRSTHHARPRADEAPVTATEPHQLHFHVRSPSLASGDSWGVVSVHSASPRTRSRALSHDSALRTPDPLDLSSPNTPSSPPADRSERADPVLEQLIAHNAAVYERLQPSSPSSAPAASPAAPSSPPPPPSLVHETHTLPVPMTPSVPPTPLGLGIPLTPGLPSTLSPAWVPDTPEGIHDYVHSTRLTRMIELANAPNTGLRVSVADVGDPSGQPVLVFLGLGAVRHLVGLYDDLARAMGLRLICADRWGLGRTDAVSTSEYGVRDWASVMGEVADQLSVGRFALLAHSAGAPFAVATALAFPKRVVGPIHLLAPWVSPDPAIEPGYSWLRYVPHSLLRTAQTAEWHVQGWKLGRPLAPPNKPPASSPMHTPSSTPVSLPDAHHGRAASWAESTPLIMRRSEDDLRNAAWGARVARSVSALGDRPEDRPGGRARSGSAAAALEAPARGSLAQPSTLIGAEDDGEGEVEVLSFDTDLALEDPEPEDSRERSVTGHHHWFGTDRESSRSSRSSLGEFRSAVAPATSPSRSPCVSPLPSPSKGLLRSSSGRSKNRPRRPRTPSAGSLTFMPRRRAPTDALGTALLQAAHAEATYGSTSDLVRILTARGAKPWGFTFPEVELPMVVWHGDRDERISFAGLAWMQKQMPLVEIRRVRGAGHSLMVNSRVIVEVLESIARHAPSACAW